MGKTQKIVGFILILLAIALGGYAWMLSTRMAADQRAAQPKMQPVVVAVSRIPAGSLITPAMLRVSNFLTRPEGAYAEPGAIVGNIATADIAAGEAVLQERLGGGLRAMMKHIQPNERAIAVRVDEVVAVGNRLNPGDQVDVFLTLHRNNTEIVDTQSRLLLDKVNVLAFGSKDVGSAKAATESGNVMRQQSTENPKTAVLAIKVSDVDKLILAAESGRLMLALRPHEQPELAEDAANVSTASPGMARQPVSSAPGSSLRAEPPPVGAKSFLGRPGERLERSAASTQTPLTLKELVAMTKSSANPKAQPARAARYPKATTKGRKPGNTVVVMHGLNEKTVYLSETNGKRP